MNYTEKRTWLHRTVEFLSWSSPFFDLYLFFPLGALFIFKNRITRQIAWMSFWLGVAGLVFSGLLLASNLTSELDGLENNLYLGWLLLFEIITGPALLFWQRRDITRRLPGNKLKISRKRHLFLHFFLAFIFTFTTAWLTGENDNNIDLYSVFYLYYAWIFGAMYLLSGYRIPFLFRKAYGMYYRQIKISRTGNHHRKQTMARWRQMLLPGWGDIYLGHFWKGFPLLFVYLLLLLFLSTFAIAKHDPFTGVLYLLTFGLKFGTGDKKFLELTTSWLPLAILSVLVVLTYIYAWYSLKLDREKAESGKPEKGFFNNLAISILVHFVLLTLVWLIPVTISRKTDSSRQATGDPDEYSFFTSIVNPEDTEKLNGGEFSGNENEKTAIKQHKLQSGGDLAESDVKPGLKGKKIDPTYSGYISMKLRQPGYYADYWNNAPYPYSCVVEYTITPDGELNNVQMIEGSGYPEQDQLTLELIENMSPLFPYPKAKGDVRVTELFWNGMGRELPTPLQNELAGYYDGRLLEEL